jgi:Zn-dependent peptidase ImmA (M78 family)
MKTITLQAPVLRWARRRAGFNETALAARMGIDAGTVTHWERTGEITLAKAELLASKTHTPVGYLFLRQPPHHALPIKDFRTIGDSGSPVTINLLEIVYEAQRRQEWYREHLIEQGAEPLSFVGKLSINASPEDSAREICKTFKIGPSLSTLSSDWKANLILHVEALEEQGVLVMRSSVVGYTRKLSVADFRGFALADKFAPVIFLNSADSQAAQLFTLAHELVHICIGESAVSNLNSTYAPAQRVESFCNAVAAEILLPLKELISGWVDDDVNREIQKFSSRYKISTLVVLRRAKDAGFMSHSEFQSRYRKECARLRGLAKKKKKQGNFYSTMNARVSSRIARAIIASTLEGATLYRDAMGLLGVKSANVINKIAQKLGYT